MGDLTFIDAAYAGAISGGPYDGVVFYVGGDAFHVWPVADVDARPERFRLPAWVRSNPGAVSPTADAAACLAALHAYKVPAGALVALDSETSIDPDWVHWFVLVLNDHGYPVIDYGSESTVFGNANPNGYYWGADWTGVRHLAAGNDMTQYASFKNQDLDVASSTLPFWDTRPPVTPTQWTEFNMARLPVLREGAADVAGGGFWYVRRLQMLTRMAGMLQGLQAAANLQIDGQYGPLTVAAVRAVQHAYSITADGVAGPQTWSVLLTGSPG